MSLGLAGKLGAQGSLFLGQQCSREDAHEPCVEHFSGLTQGAPSCRTGSDRGTSGSRSPLQSEAPAPSASPNRGPSESFCLSSCSVHGTCLFGWLVLVFVGRAVCGILVP